MADGDSGNLDTTRFPSSVDDAGVEDPGEGVPFTVGFGPECGSAQVSLLTAKLWLTDRDAMKKTVLRGQPVVRWQEISNSIRRLEVVPCKNGVGYQAGLFDGLLGRSHVCRVRQVPHWQAH